MQKIPFPLKIKQKKTICPPDLTHTAVMVRFECKKGHSTWKTYEIMGENNKWATWGLYTLRYMKDELVWKRDSGVLMYPHVEQQYRAMWADYNFAYKNCKKWSSDFEDSIGCF